MISALTDQQLQAAVDACVQRCCAGNQFAPDLAEFMGIVSSDVTNPFGLKVEEVITEWRRYCRTRHQYSCPETFNWKQPVLYHICCTLRSEMIDRNLNDIEIEKRAVVHLKAWSDKVRAGGKVPEPRPLLSEKPTGRRTHDGGTGRAEVLAILEKLRHTNRK
ncbi:replication protein P [Cedecea davisae]|uniref:replication protein P n=1 Tax=Cedecea davisae TaxID=158484 RepID=UPI00376ECFF1